MVAQTIRLGPPVQTFWPLGVGLFFTFGILLGCVYAQEKPAANPPAQEKPTTVPDKPGADKPGQEKPAEKKPLPQELAPPIKEKDAPAPPNDPKAVAVINRYVEAIGGRPILDGIKDKQQKFETIKHAPTGETTAVLNLYLKRDYKVREEWDLPGFNIKDQPLRFVQVYNGVEGWVQMLGTVSPLEGRTLSIFVWDKPIDDFFCHWEEDGYSVGYVGEDALALDNKGQLEKEPVEVIETTDFTGKSKARYFFSKNSGLLLKREWREQGQSGFDKKEAFYSKYTKIPFKDDATKGIQVALLQTIKSNGEVDTERKYTELAINAGLNDAIFERPPGPLFKGAIGEGGKSIGPQGEKAGPNIPVAPGGEAEKPPEGSGPKKEPVGPKPIPIKKEGHPHGTEPKKDQPPPAPPPPPPAKP
ncbi:MAG: hypothetical protein HY717_17265 [Planctomycetes bacterium]|nr:hypothetical protein [Planctomycetota bacterium]